MKAFSLNINYSPSDTVGDLKKLIAAQTGTRPEKIVLKKWYSYFNLFYVLLIIKNEIMIDALIVKLVKLN